LRTPLDAALAADAAAPAAALAALAALAAPAEAAAVAVAARCGNMSLRSVCEYAEQQSMNRWSRSEQIAFDVAYALYKQCYITERGSQAQVQTVCRSSAAGESHTSQPFLVWLGS